MSAGSSSYSNQRTVAATASIAIDGANTCRTLPLGQSFQINEVFVVMQTAYTGATATVITVKRETVVTVTQVSIGSFTIPITAAAGDVFRIDFRTLGDTLLATGEAIAFVSDGGADATTTAWFGVLGYETRFGSDPYPFTSFTTVDKDRSGVGDIKYLAATEI